MQNVKRNEQAVSPVIGVILMVVITVIIAAVLAVFAFGVGAPTQSPTASIKITSVDKTGSTVWVQHYGGDSVRLQDVKLTIETLDSNGGIVATGVYSQAATSGQFSAGDTLKISTNAPGVFLNGNSTSTAVGSPAVALTGADSVRITVIHIPTGDVLSKPAAKIT